LIDPDVFTIKFESNLEKVENNIHLLRNNYEGITILRTNKGGFIDVKVPKNKHSLDYVELLKKDSLIDIVFYNTIGRYSYVPDDEYYEDQWHLPKIKMENIWSHTAGAPCIVVAILDSGVDWEHEDLGEGEDNYQNIWLNSGEDDWTDPDDPSTGNDQDNDGNGFIDDWKGWDFDDDENDSRDQVGHGTNVAGVAGAKGDNDIGVAGVAGGLNENGISLMCVGVGDQEPVGAILDDAIYYAVDNGASIIQMSLSVVSNQAIQTALEDAYEEGVVIVCAAGNYPPGTSSVRFPATDENVIAVGGTTSSDTRAYFACYGEELEISAPSVGIYTTDLNDEYDDPDGTSFAAPQVSAASALLLTISPNLDPDDIREILTSTADKVGSYNYNWDPNNQGHSKELGYGRLNVKEAIESILPTLSGQFLVCSSPLTTFTLNDRPAGTTLSWSTSNNLHEDSSPGETIRVRAKTTSSVGDGWVRAEITSHPNCMSYSITYDDIWVGKFESTPVEGQAAVCPNSLYVYTADVPGGHSSSYSYSWIYPSGWYYYSQWSNNIHLQTPILLANMTYGPVRVSITNACGTSGYSGVTTYPGYNCGGYYMATPNPSKDYTDIDIVPEMVNTLLENYENEILISIFNNMGISVRTAKVNSLPYRIDTSVLSKGEYMIRIITMPKSGTEENQRVETLKIIVNH
jgi:hypothetical protein